MNKIQTLLCLILAFCLSTSVFSQSPLRPNSLVFKRIVSDYHLPTTGDILEFGNYRGGFEVSYLRNVGKSLNAVIPVRVGVINLPGEVENRTAFGIDGLMQFQYFEFKNPIIPYVFTGLGASFEEGEDMNLQVPIGIGVNFRLGKNSYINLETQFRKSFVSDRDNVQHGIGLAFMIGKTVEDSLEILSTDLDQDGIVDQADKCPETPGIAAFNGCPDTDEDGIQDSEDDCPEVPGVLAFKGCPDTDGDGVMDKEDDCPRIKGVINGCPDTDGDGLADPEDECPEVAGLMENQGCPEKDRDRDGFVDKDDRCPDIAGTVGGCPDRDGDGFADLEDECPDTEGTVKGCPDTDGDGTIDKDDPCPHLAGPLNAFGCPDTDGDGLDDGKDRCPNSPGPASADGCPEIRQEDRAVLEYAIQAVQFQTGSAKLRALSYDILDQVADIMYRYPDYKLVISGHTDNTGSEERNLQLSDDRAKACYDYLIKVGVSEARITYVGFGEAMPIASNERSSGRRLNRRVEFELLPLKN